MSTALVREVNATTRYSETGRGELSQSGSNRHTEERKSRELFRKRGDNPHRRGEIGRDETGVVRHRGGAIGAYNEAVKQVMGERDGRIDGVEQ